MMTEWMDNIVTVVIVTIFIWTLLLVWVWIWWTFSMFKDAQYEYKIIQCLSQSGTTWQWGECVIILNK